MEPGVQAGAKLVTADGRELGQVKKVEGPAFLVDAPRQLDYWLHTNLAKSATAQRVELSISEADLGAYKMDNPYDHNEFQAKVPEQFKPTTVRGRIIN